jgi:hypothetical protein
MLTSVSTFGIHFTQCFGCDDSAVGDVLASLVFLFLKTFILY